MALWAGLFLTIQMHLLLKALEIHFDGCLLNTLLIITSLSYISVFSPLQFLKKVELFWKKKLIVKGDFQYKLPILFHVQTAALPFQLPCSVLCLMTFVSDLFLFHNAGYILVHFNLYVILVR